MTNIFERASKQKLRFRTAKGFLSTEDLWELSLESLDVLAKKTNADLKDSAEESFISKKTTTNAKLSLKMDIIKHVIAYKLELKDKAATRAEKNAKIAQLKELIAENSMKELKEKSSDDLQKMLADLQETP